MFFIKSHANKEKKSKAPRNFKTPAPKVQIPAKKSNFQFKFPKNSPLKFKSTPKIPTFAPGTEKIISKSSNYPPKHPKNPLKLSVKHQKDIKTHHKSSNFPQKIQLSPQIPKKLSLKLQILGKKFQLSPQTPKKLSPKLQIIPQNTRKIP